MDFFMDEGSQEKSIDFSQVRHIHFNGTNAGGLSLNGMQIKTPFKAIPFSGEKWWGSISEKHTDGDQLHLELYFIPLDGDLKYSLCSLIIKSYSLRNLMDCLLIARNNFDTKELALEVDVITVTGKHTTKQVKFGYSKLDSEHQWITSEIQKAKQDFSEGKLIIASNVNPDYLIPYKDHLALQAAK